MNLWPQILFLVIHLPFMMEVLWHNSLLAMYLLVFGAYGIKSQKHFINALYDNIKTRGAMDTIITDGGKYEISKNITDLLRSIFIKYESEPYRQHQNKAEKHYGVFKRYINTLMNLTGAPAQCWLLCLVHVYSLLNVQPHSLDKYLT